MQFALTTHWNAFRHADGETLIEEILELGLTHVELGYDLRLDLVPGVMNMIKKGAVTVDTLHNYCPVPIGAPRGHPELYTLGDSDPRIRELAVQHTTRTLRFAAETGAKVVVTHCGNVEMTKMSMQLVGLANQGQRFTELFEKTKLKLQIAREKKAPKQIEYLYRGIEQLLPILEETNVKLALENLPTWEAIPSEIEMENLFKHFKSDRLGYWHDVGHGQIRNDLGFINLDRWLDRLTPYLLGMHVHDVSPALQDHVLPPYGKVDFNSLKKVASDRVFKVLEPAPDAPKEGIVEAVRFLKERWEGNSGPASAKGNS